ncbi:MAG TPA: hypothetical protein VFO76_00005, partial [Candidatus Kapabacteria bacterium]|nr:hypothetical protein [Candidatus Kapabacteria bacterium]
MKRTLYRVLPLLAILALTGKGVAQPIVDSVKAMQKSNEKTYRFLSALDPYGESYTFTNVIKWHVVDPELLNELKALLVKEPFNVDPKTFRVDDIYIFSAPVAGTDRVEPFHLLVEGVPIEKKKAKSGALSMFGSDEDQGGTKVKRAFQGKSVIQLMHRTPSLLEDVNTIQGENVEIPGEIVPHGSQLVKDVRMRYTFAKMFTQFYSKRAIVDEIRQSYG